MKNEEKKKKRKKKEVFLSFFLSFRLGYGDKCPIYPAKFRFILLGTTRRVTAAKDTPPVVLGHGHVAADSDAQKKKRKKLGGREKKKSFFFASAH